MTDSERRLQGIAQDRRSGATELTRQAAGALTQRLDERGDQANWPTDLMAFAERLMNAQPAMASIRNLARRAQAATHDESCDATRAAIDRFINDLEAGTGRIAEHAVSLLPDEGRVVTISSSSTVAAALQHARDNGHELRVVCPESRPLGEGTSLAKVLAEAGLETTICADALAPSFVRDADVVLVGGDALAPEGLVNKSGTFPLALAARYFSVPCVALISRLKALDRFDADWIAEMDPTEIADVEEAIIHVVNRYFELTPLELLTHVVTETGMTDSVSFNAGDA